MNLNEIFRNNAIYDNVKSHKKDRLLLSLSLEDIFFGKPKDVKLTPRQPFKV